jgi:hypothetical protein
MGRIISLLSPRGYAIWDESGIFPSRVDKTEYETLREARLELASRAAAGKYTPVKTVRRAYPFSLPGRILVVNNHDNLIRLCLI